jgi:hypothetical protein
MRWPWQKRTPPPRIPPYPVPVAKPKPKEEGVVVEEIDTSTVDEQALQALRAAQSQTGMHRAWKRLTGQDRT